VTEKNKKQPSSMHAGVVKGIKGGRKGFSCKRKCRNRSAQGVGGTDTHGEGPNRRTMSGQAGKKGKRRQAGGCQVGRPAEEKKKSAKKL